MLMLFLRHEGFSSVQMITDQLHYIQETYLMEACVQKVSSICAWLSYSHCRGYYHRSKYCLSISILLSLNIKKKQQKNNMLWYHSKKTNKIKQNKQ